MRLKLRCRCANRIRLEQIDKNYYIKTTGYEINRIEQYRLQSSVIEKGLFIGMKLILVWQAWLTIGLVSERPAEYDGSESQRTAMLSPIG